MNKKQLLELISITLSQALYSAKKAADDAHLIATHRENIAENKYDTLGLEAAYLAHGQSQRVAKCEADIQAFSTLGNVEFTSSSVVAVGALITLLDDADDEQQVYLGPAAGGIKINIGQKTITLITTSAPLGSTLLGCSEGDEINLTVNDKVSSFEIIAIE